jgi:LysM repeat protein
MVDRSPGRRSAARYLVPLALAATIVSTVLIVEHGLKSHGSAARTASHTGTRRQSAQTTNRAQTNTAPTSYTVRAGDTLGVIASRFNVSVAQLEQLNPKLNPNALQVGQQVRLRQ